MIQPTIYFFFGAAGSGRRKIIKDLILNGLDSENQTTLLVSPDETPMPIEEDCPTSLSHVHFLSWKWKENGLSTPDIPEGTDTLFFLSDGRRNPMDQIEAFHGWLSDRNWELGRTITIVNCRLAHDYPDLIRWYDACIYFSDAVLLNKRNDLSPKWMQDFLKRYQSDCYPCIFENVKKDSVPNPGTILEVETRRMSHIFDTLPPIDAADIEEAFETELSEDIALDTDPQTDPFLVRNAAGRRKKIIPDIGEFLEPVDKPETKSL